LNPREVQLFAAGQALSLIYTPATADRHEKSGLELRGPGIGDWPPVFFADPQSPWQRGTSENTNGPLRQYFPKGTDLSRWSAQEIEGVAHALNTRPRKTLGWKTPAEAFNELLLSPPQAGVASTS
jgi:hypothetical protein